MRCMSRIACILLLVIGIAAAANAAHPRGIRWFVPRQAVYPEPTAEQKAAAVDRDQVLAAVEQGTVILDARKADRYAQGHIPGTVNIPAEDAQEQLSRMSDLALAEDALIVYCGGDDCDESRTLFDRLKELGFVNLRIYFGGWRDWTEHDMPVEQ